MFAPRRAAVCGVADVGRAHEDSGGGAAESLEKRRLLVCASACLGCLDGAVWDRGLDDESRRDSAIDEYRSEERK